MKIRKGFEHLASKGMQRELTLPFDPTDYADPLFGVGSATSAGPTLPAGSVHISPETLVNDCGGYLRGYPIIGFGHAYTSGSGGIKCFGNYVICPTVDGIEFDNKKRARFAKEGTEKSRSYEYKVELENDIKIKMTPAHNSALHSHTYPAGKESTLLIDVAHKLDIDAAMRKGFVTLDPENKTVYGGGTYFGNMNNTDWEMYFYMEFDSDFTEIGSFKGEILKAESGTTPTTVTVDTEERLGAYVKFGTFNKETEIKVKLAVSFVSVEKAKEFLYTQIPGFDYDNICEQARNKWRKVLSVIELTTDDKALLRRFYTAMYHMNVQPRDRVSDNGVWDDFHTVWDTWKTVFPMYSLLYPEKMAALVDSFIYRAEKNKEANNGVVIGDEFMAAIECLAGQGGNDIDNAIADAYLKGIKLNKYTWEDAYKVLLRSAEEMRSPEYITKGYVTDNAVTVTGLPYTWRCKPAAATMGFAFNDKAISIVAKELGTKEDQEKFEKRSKNWLNVWNMDAVSEGFKGFPQIKRNDGTFAPDFDPHKGYNEHFYEMTGWDASYVNYNDVSGLIEAMGGKERFIERLLWACDHSKNYFNDDDGKEGYLNFTNEPSFQIPWLFCTDEIKRPDLAAKVIADIIPRFSLPDDYPGDEDNGGMSSYYVFLMCGFFPYSTTENYYLHGTRVEKITFRLGNGNNFTVTGENVGENNIYVQSATWNGKEFNSCKLTHKEIISGGRLHFVMGDKPSNWARE